MKEFSVADYKQRVEELIIKLRNISGFLLVGGTGLYIQAIVDHINLILFLQIGCSAKAPTGALQYGNNLFMISYNKRISFQKYIK